MYCFEIEFLFLLCTLIKMHQGNFGAKLMRSQYLQYYN